MDNKLDIEAYVGKWAERKGYPLTRRYWVDELSQLKTLKHEFDFLPSDPREVYEEFYPDYFMGLAFKRFIYSPTGYIEYALNFKGIDVRLGTRPSDERTARAFMAKRTDFSEVVTLFHGSKIDDWASDKTTFQTRNDNADLFFEVWFHTPSRRIVIAALHPVYHENVLFKGGKTRRIKSGESRFNNFGLALDILLSNDMDEGIKIPNLEKAHFDSEFDIDGGTPTYLDLVFKRFDEVIASSE